VDFAVVCGIVQRHGGQIEVDSELKRGTTFTIVLPRRPGYTGTSPRPKRDQVPDHPGPDPGGGPRVGGRPRRRAAARRALPAGRDLRGDLRRLRAWQRDQTDGPRGTGLDLPHRVAAWFLPLVTARPLSGPDA